MGALIWQSSLEKLTSFLVEKHIILRRKDGKAIIGFGNVGLRSKPRVILGLNMGFLQQDC